MRVLGIFLVVFGVLAGEKVSVAVPCYEGHVAFLRPLLEAYAEQSRVPDEVVISLSGCAKIEEGVIEEIEAGWPFEVKVVRWDERRTEAENRTAACLNTTGDVVLTNDADDIPHRQRVEVVTYFMERYPHCMCLIHTWTEDLNCVIDPAGVGRFFLRHWNDFYRWEMTHSANIAIRRGVLKRVQWRNLDWGVDRDFLIRCQKVFHKTMVIDAPLIEYRNELSSYNCRDALIRKEAL